MSYSTEMHESCLNKLYFVALKITEGVADSCQKVMEAIAPRSV